MRSLISPERRMKNAAIPARTGERSEVHLLALLCVFINLTVIMMNEYTRNKMEELGIAREALISAWANQWYRNGTEKTLSTYHARLKYLTEIEKDPCHQCIDIYRKAVKEKKLFSPPHYGSARCNSGSLSSGGDKAHCSCDICF